MPQSELVAHLLGEVVFLPRDGVAAPADHDIRRLSGTQHARVAQHAEHRVGDAVAGFQVEAFLHRPLLMDEHDIPQRREQVFAHAVDHHPVHEGLGGGVEEFKLHAP